MDERAREGLRRGAYFYLVLIATVLMAFGVSTIVTVRLIERSERKLCAVVISADEGFRQSPPPTAAGRVQAEQYSRLRRELGCPPHKGD